MQFPKPAKKPKKDKSRKHSNACLKYKIAFQLEHGAIFCESTACEGKDFFYSTHHLYRAARYSGHAEFHNPLNMILLCQTCHGGFDQYKRPAEFAKLEADRGLKELFGEKR